MRSVNPYLNFASETAQAMEFYSSVFGRQAEVIRFRDFGDHGQGLPESEKDLVMHAYLDLGGGNALMASDVPPSMGMSLTTGSNVHVMIVPDDAAEARRVFDALSRGGHVVMPLAESDWAELYGAVTDRFGIRWMVNFGGSKEQQPQ